MKMFPYATYANPVPAAYYSERWSPVPGWGMNPRLAGPRWIAVGEDPPAAYPPSLILLGVIAAATAGWILVKTFGGDTAKRNGKKKGGKKCKSTGLKHYYVAGYSKPKGARGRRVRQASHACGLKKARRVQKRMRRKGLYAMVSTRKPAGW